LAETNLGAIKEGGRIAGPECTRGGTCYSPQVDIYETADEVVLTCDVPGVRPEDLSVEFSKGGLSICGKVPPRRAPAEYAEREYGVGDYYRSFTIGPEIDADRIVAECREGVLTVCLPKPEKARPKRIAVQAG
jgi:HSP20 family protein